VAKSAKQRRELEDQLGQLGQHLEETQNQLQLRRRCGNSCRMRAEAVDDLPPVSGEPTGPDTVAAAVGRSPAATSGAKRELPCGEDQAGSADEGICRQLRPAAEQRVASLTTTLAEESKRREGAEQQAGEISQRRSELEAELAQNKQPRHSCGNSWRPSRDKHSRWKRTTFPSSLNLRHETNELHAAQVPVEQTDQVSH